MRRLAQVVPTLAVAAFMSCSSAEQASLLVRARNFLVPPSTGPVTHVLVKNPLDTPYGGTLTVEFPEGWKVTPSEHPLALSPGEVKQLPFTIESGANASDNAYPVRICVGANGDELTVEQTVVCASAPYYRPTINGDLREWGSAIPLTLMTGGRQTVVRACWNRRQFCLAVEVDEAELVSLASASVETGMDAVQFALSRSPEAPGGPNDDRYGFLVAAQAPGDPHGACFLLRQPGQAPELAAERRSLQGLGVSDAQVAVTRAGQVTCYEIAIPFALMGDLRPAPGRELCFSVLVHDPDGTGVRDLGELMNLWDEHRRPGGWCSWDGVIWGETVPFASAIEFGLCSSVE